MATADQKPAKAAWVRHSVWEKAPQTDLTQEVVAGPPCKLMLSLNGGCNLRCRHCTRFVRPGLPGAEMPRDLLDAVIERLLPGMLAVRLGGNDYGEQLLGGNMAVFLDALLALEPRPHLEVITNGLLMTEEIADRLVRADAHIYVSLEGTGPEYTMVRRRPWAELARVFDVLDSVRRGHPESRAELTLYVCATLDALESIRDLVRHPLPGVDRVRVRHFYNRHYRQAMQSLFYNRALANRFLEELRADGEESGLDLDLPPPFEFRHLGEAAPVFLGRESPVRLPCHKPFELVSVQSDGSVFPCCGMAPRVGRLDAGTKDIEPIWNGPALRQLRRVVNTRNAPVACKRCEDVETEPGAFMMGAEPRLVQDIPTRPTGKAESR